jgi:hypothetical protein
MKLFVLTPAPRRGNPGANGPYINGGRTIRQKLGQARSRCGQGHILVARSRDGFSCANFQAARSANILDAKYEK